MVVFVDFYLADLGPPVPSNRFRADTPRKDRPVTQRRVLLGVEDGREHPPLVLVERSQLRRLPEAARCEAGQGCAVAPPEQHVVLPVRLAAQGEVLVGQRAAPAGRLAVEVQDAARVLGLSAREDEEDTEELAGPYAGRDAARGATNVIDDVLGRDPRGGDLVLGQMLPHGVRLDDAVYRIGWHVPSFGILGRSPVWARLLQCGPDASR